MTSETTRTLRDDLRRSALLAVHHWLLANLSDAATLAGAAGHAGQPDTLVVMRAESNWDDPTSEDDELREALLAVDIASATGVTRLTRETYASWPEVVGLWTDLREAFANAAMAPPAVNLVIDVSNLAVVSYEPIHCPEVGYECDMYVSAKRPPLGTGDPFEEMLAAAEQDKEEDIEDRVEALLEKWQLDPPSVPHDGPCNDA